MNNPRKDAQKQFTRRLLLLCVGALPVYAVAIVLLRREMTAAALAVLVLGMGGLGVLILLAVRARDRAESAQLQPLYEIRTYTESEPDPAFGDSPVRELLVQDFGMNNCHYRVVEGPEQYHFIRMKHFLLGPSPEQLAAPISTLGSDADIRARYRRGFTVAKSEIRELRLKFGNYEMRGANFFAYGKLTLHTAKKKRTFLLLCSPEERSPAEVESFFDAVCPTIRMDESDRKEGQAYRQKKLDRAGAVLEALGGKQNPETARAFRKWVPVADYLLLILPAFLMLADYLFSGLSRVWETFLFVFAMLPWAALLLAPHYISLIGSELPERTWLEQHGITLVSPIFGLFIPSSILAIMNVSEFEAHPAAVILWGCAIAVVLTSAAYLRTPAARRYLGVFIAVWLLCAMFGSGIALGINQLFDWRASETEQVQLLARQDGEMTYRDASGALRTCKLNLFTARDLEDWEYGQKAEIVHHSGALGMEWEELRGRPMVVPTVGGE